MVDGTPEPTSADAATGAGPAKPAKKGVSPTRQVIGVLALFGVLLFGGKQLAAIIGHNRAVWALDKRMQEEDKELMLEREVEDLIGRTPDNPGEEITQNQRTFTKKTYTWIGPLKVFTLTAYYTKEKNPGLHHFEPAGTTYEPDPLPPPPVARQRPSPKATEVAKSGGNPGVSPDKTSVAASSAASAPVTPAPASKTDSAQPASAPSSVTAAVKAVSPSEATKPK